MGRSGSGKSAVYVGCEARLERSIEVVEDGVEVS